MDRLTNISSTFDSISNLTGQVSNTTIKIDTETITQDATINVPVSTIINDHKNEDKLDIIMNHTSENQSDVHTDNAITTNSDTNTSPTLSIYILTLEHNKYYIGKSRNPISRIKQHCDGTGPEWTQLHKPIPNKFEIISNCDDFDEVRYTLIYMDKYGIENVRGANFSKAESSDIEQIILKKMLDGINDRCYNCGSNEHFAIDCNMITCENKVSVDPTQIYLNVPYPHKDYAKELGCRWDFDRKKWYCMSNHSNANECVRRWG